MTNSSRLAGFYRKSVLERADILQQWANLTEGERRSLTGEQGLTPQLADQLIENVVGIHSLPLGIAANFTVNGRDVLVPMAVEEPSIVAGASFMAKLARETGGFSASSTLPEMIGQVQVLALDDLAGARDTIINAKAELIEAAGRNSQTMIARGGGPRDIEVRLFEETPIGPMLIVHLIFDVQDAQGANMVNTACESLAGPLAKLTGGRVGLRILSNLTDRRLAKASCTIKQTALAFDEFSGEQVVNGVVEAWAFAAVDPYRATTHNKGIMNGIDPIAVATGNDWRALEAGAHAYAARSGQYTSLSTWQKNVDGDLVGEIEVPLAVGIVGGSTWVHPTTKTALKILNVNSANELAEIMAAVGLAQNLAALRALATEGIQQGHMSLHARQIAVAAGAEGREVEQITEAMLANKQITLTYAQTLLENLRQV